MDVDKFIKEAQFGDIAKLPAIELVGLIRSNNDLKLRNEQLEKEIALLKTKVNTTCVGITSHGILEGVNHISYDEFISTPNKPVNVTISSRDLVNVLKDFETVKAVASERFTQIKRLDKKISDLNIKFAPTIESNPHSKTIEVEGVSRYIIKSPYGERGNANVSLNG